MPDIIDKARLQQATVTKELRVQAHQAVERFVQELLDNPDNAAGLAEYTDRQELAKQLWREGLILIYRLLFILKLESTDDPARAFTFASTSLWRNTFSPTVALAARVRDVVDRGAVTGRFLEDGLKALFRMFTEGVQCTELNVKPLGGALFGQGATPIVSKLHWGERAVAFLLDRLLWTPKTHAVARSLETGDIEDPRPWNEAYKAGVGSPLELKFLRLFEQYDFQPQKQVPIAPSDAEAPISVADFAVPESRLAIYVDGASVHIGANLRRDRYIRDRLRNGDPPWQVEVLGASDLARGREVVAHLRHLARAPETDRRP